MYGKSARYYDALHYFKDYRAEAQAVEAIIRANRPDAASVLDIACGTGRHLAELGGRYRRAGLDLNADFIAIARERCPEAGFHVGDMTDFDIGETFDVVTCLFSSIGYARDTAGLASAMACIARHLNPGGLVLIEPWFTPDTYWVGHLVANHVDEPDLKISWMYYSELRDGLSVLDNHYLVGTPDGIAHFHEVYELGLFTREDHMAAFARAGLQASYDEDGLKGRGFYIARKSAQ